jgi:hypothetical protein
VRPFWPVAKALGIDSTKKGITVYLVSSPSVSNTLVAKALNADGWEIGRARKDVVMKKEDAAYVTFEFDGEMDTQLVKRYAIGL